MKKAIVLILGLPLALGVFAGCAEPVASGPSLGEEFTLQFGESALIASEGLTLRFDDVISDSRCPSDVVCIRAGEAEVKLAAIKNSQEAALILVEPGLTSGVQMVKYSEYSIEYRIEPYPVSTRVLEEADYRLRLKVTR